MTAERRRLLCTAGTSICANMILFFLKKAYESVAELNGDQLQPLGLCSVISVNSALEIQILHSVTSKHTSKDKWNRGETAREPGRFLFLKNTQICITVSTGLPQEIFSSE